ncbi:MAG TPA: crosslink repair DNA glycosylase YcaQ family protein, partial [Ktedonobacterales bacterium]
PALLVNGRAVGVWKLQRGKRRLDVIVEPFERLLPDVQPGLEAEAADIARFLEMQASLHIRSPAS